jgi:succinylglutamate desuccinylase
VGRDSFNMHIHIISIFIVIVIALHATINSSFLYRYLTLQDSKLPDQAETKASLSNISLSASLSSSSVGMPICFFQGAKEATCNPTSMVPDRGHFLNYRIFFLENY